MLYYVEDFSHVLSMNVSILEWNIIHYFYAMLVYCASLTMEEGGIMLWYVGLPDLVQPVTRERFTSYASNLVN